MSEPREPVLDRHKKEYKRANRAFDEISHKSWKHIEQPSGDYSISLLKKQADTAKNLVQKINLLISSLQEASNSNQVEEESKSPATPRTLSKIAGIALKDLAESSGYSRQWLLHLFNKDRNAFEDILFVEMRSRLNDRISNEVEQLQTEEDLLREYNEKVKELRTAEDVKVEMSENLDLLINKIQKAK